MISHLLAFALGAAIYSTIILWIIKRDNRRFFEQLDRELEGVPSEHF